MHTAPHAPFCSQFLQEDPFWTVFNCSVAKAFLCRRCSSGQLGPRIFNTFPLTTQQPVTLPACPAQQPFVAVRTLLCKDNIFTLIARAYNAYFLSLNRFLLFIAFLLCLFVFLFVYIYIYIYIYVCVCVCVCMCMCVFNKVPTAISVCMCGRSYVSYFSGLFIYKRKLSVEVLDAAEGQALATYSVQLTNPLSFSSIRSSGKPGT